jgi:hypothetical protein
MTSLQPSLDTKAWLVFRMARGAANWSTYFLQCEWHKGELYLVVTIYIYLKKKNFILRG